MRRALALLLVAASAALPACADSGSALTVYSGRSRDLVDPLLQRFADETGIDVEVRYGDTAELAATILEEGDNSPADVFFAQDAGALGAVGEEGRLAGLDDALLERVPARFRSDDGLWVGTSGRARVLAYSLDRVPAAELPRSVFDLTGAEWEGRVGWAPQNGSFQAFVTALRLLEGEERARDWLEDMVVNGVEEYPNNIAIVQAVDRGEIDVGLVNHYYALQLASEDRSLRVKNHFFPGRDPGALVNVAGAAVLEGSGQAEDAVRLVEFLLSEESQRYFAQDVFEYPLVEGVDAPEGAPPLAEIDSPRIDLSRIDDLRGTLDLLEEVGAL